MAILLKIYNLMNPGSLVIIVPGVTKFCGAVGSVVFFSLLPSRIFKSNPDPADILQHCRYPIKIYMKFKIRSRNLLVAKQI